MTGILYWRRIDCQVFYMSRVNWKEEAIASGHIQGVVFPESEVKDKHPLKIKTTDRQL